jgi:hypothetical protein
MQGGRRRRGLTRRFAMVTSGCQRPDAGGPASEKTRVVIVAQAIRRRLLVERAEVRQLTLARLTCPQRERHSNPRSVRSGPLDIDVV